MQTLLRAVKTASESCLEEEAALPLISMAWPSLLVWEQWCVQEVARSQEGVVPLTAHSSCFGKAIQTVA